MYGVVAVPLEAEGGRQSTIAILVDRGRLKTQSVDVAPHVAFPREGRGVVADDDRPDIELLRPCGCVGSDELRRRVHPVAFEEVDVIARLETDACLRVVAFHKPVIGDEIPVVIGICAEPHEVTRESTYRRSDQANKQASLFIALTPKSPFVRCPHVRGGNARGGRRRAQVRAGCAHTMAAQRGNGRESGNPAGIARPTEPVRGWL